MFNNINFELDLVKLWSCYIVSPLPLLFFPPSVPPSHDALYRSGTRDLRTLNNCFPAELNSQLTGQFSYFVSLKVL